MHEPFPSISKIYALVLQEESHKSVGHGGFYIAKPNSVAMYANLKGNNSGNPTWSKGNNKKERPLCTHYNMLGHTIDKCYKLHGYPLGYKPKGRSSANQVTCNLGTATQSGSIQCPISEAQCEQLLAFLNAGCNFGENHHAINVSTGNGLANLGSGVVDVCSFTGVPYTTGVATTNPYPQAHNSYLETMSGIVSNLAFSPNLTHSIFSAKLVNRTYFETTDWVIDTSATDHMVHSVSCFTTLIATLNTHVNLPNGEVALVTHIGTNENLVLYNVLCVPSFSFNLISVS